MGKIKFIVGKTSTGYDAYLEIKDSIVVVTTGSNMTELKANALEGYNLYLEEKDLPIVTSEQITFEFELPSFFEYFKEVNASALSKRIGMNKSLLSEYVNGKRKPSAKQVQKILDGVRQLGKELNEVEFVM